VNFLTNNSPRATSFGWRLKGGFSRYHAILGEAILRHLTRKGGSRGGSGEGKKEKRKGWRGGRDRNNKTHPRLEHRDSHNNKTKSKRYEGDYKSALCSYVLWLCFFSIPPSLPPSAVPFSELAGQQLVHLLGPTLPHGLGHVRRLQINVWVGGREGGRKE